MKFAQLLLQAFGPFTNTTLDFASGNSNLHLIYGPNEAGKSSALRAMTDLRFGIPLRSQDDFLHSSNQLRIGGVFLDVQGESVGLVRRKGRGTTLSQFEITSDRLDSDLPVPARHELALTGGLDRNEFEAMLSGTKIIGGLKSTHIDGRGRIRVPMDKSGYVDNKEPLPTYPRLDHRGPSRHLPTA